MDSHITPAAFNALSFSEQVQHIIESGKIIRSEEGMSVYRLMELEVEVRMEWTPLRITSVSALDPETPAAA